MRGGASQRSVDYAHATHQDDAGIFFFFCFPASLFSICGVTYLKRSYVAILHFVLAMRGVEVVRRLAPFARLERLLILE